MVAIYIAFVLLCVSEIVLGREFGSEIGVDNLEEVFAWKQISYILDESANVSNSISEMDVNFIDSYNALPMGIDRWKNKIFITVPRRRLGIPSSLNYIDLNENINNRSPPLRPYPNVKVNSMTSEKPLVNVYRTRVDVCDRLWMVDTGFYHVPRHYKEIQPASIVIYDLNTDMLLNRYELLNFRDYACNDKAGLISITIDVDKSDCNNAYAYIADTHNCRLLIYSLKENTSWSFRHNYFQLDPEESNYDVAGFRFQWDDCIYSIALGPKLENGFKNAYFHSMSSYRERYVSTKILRNHTLSLRFSHGDDFKALGTRGSNSQTATHDIHEESGIMIFGQTGNNALTCWNIKKPLAENNIDIIAQDSTKFVWPSDVKIDNEGNVWVMVNNLPIFVYAKSKPENMHYRVYRIPITKIQNITNKCN